MPCEKTKSGKQVSIKPIPSGCEQGVSSILLSGLSEGETWIGGIETSFVDVPVTEDGIDTIVWLKALVCIIEFVELFAPKAAELAGVFIHSDNQNIRNLYESAPAECSTLQKMVAYELATQPNRLASVGLMWNFRRLKLLSISFRSSLDHPTESLSASFTHGWKTYFGTYYPWYIHPLFKLFIIWCPSRAKLFQQFGGDNAEVKQELREYLDAIDEQLDMLEKLYKGLKL